MTLDHLFVMARAARGKSQISGSRSTADRWARSLIDAGFCEGSGRRHGGQGTANRRFFFREFMLELLYLDDEAELEDVAESPLALRERFGTPEASPFGLGFRPSTIHDPDATFDSVAYRPEYLPATQRIDVAQGFGVDEPLFFFLPFLAPFGQASPDGEPRDHPNGACRLMVIELQRAQAQTARLLSATGVSTVDSGARHRISLQFRRAGGAPEPDERLALADDLPLTIAIRR